MSVDASDARLMARALRLARRGLYTTHPNPRVGCVVVRDGQIVGEGWHERAGGPHAEIMALGQAADRAAGATVYLTLEPCCHHGKTPPCTDALVGAGVARVVAAMADPNPRVAGKGFAHLAGHGIEVDVGLMEAEASALNEGFVTRMRRGRPYVRIKLAASLDGRTAKADGESKWITGPAARADVQRWRARSSAILTGVGTALTDDPRLNVRDFDIGRQPLRVVVDSRLRMAGTASMLRLSGKTLVVTASADREKTESLRAAGAEVLLLAAPNGRVDLAALMRHLAASEVNELLVEAGATLCGAILEAGLVDEILIYFAPHVMGSRERAMFELPALAGMAERIPMHIRDVRAVGDDWRVIARVANGG